MRVLILLLIVSVSIVTHRVAAGTTTALSSQAHLSIEIQHLTEKAEIGNAEAQHDLGLAYYKGHGVERDYAQAAKWLRKAADQGNAEAQAYIGNMYQKGMGFQKDDAEALKWYVKAAEQGQAASQQRAGMMYEDGQGVKQDFAEALKWYRRSAEQGSRSEQELLAESYLMGNKNWSDQDPDAHYMNSLHAHEFSKLVQQDTAESVKWYRRAADQGSLDGAKFLADSYRAGSHGLPKDYVQAYFWRCIVMREHEGMSEESPIPHSRLEDDKKYIAEYEQGMTASQLVRAKGLVADWKPKDELLHH